MLKQLSKSKNVVKQDCLTHSSAHIHSGYALGHKGNDETYILYNHKS